MTKYQVAFILLEILETNPEFMLEPRGKGNYSYEIGKIYKKYPNRKTIKKAIKLLLELNCIIKLPNSRAGGYVNPCSRYRPTTEEEYNA